MARPKSLFGASADGWRRRRRLSGAPLKWPGEAVRAELRAEVVAAELAGLLDPKLLDDFQADLVQRLDELVVAELVPLREELGRAIADAAFGGTDYRNRLDRQLATGAAAMAEVVIEERLPIVASALSLRVACEVSELVPPRLPARVGSPAGVGDAP